jgi:hypothetical protein
MDTVMRRSCVIPFTLLMLALVSFPVAARMSPLSNAGEDATSCSDAGGADDQADPANKSTATKRTAAPTATKARPAVRGSDTAPGRAPRWHRFLPGMYR